MAALTAASWTVVITDNVIAGTPPRRSVSGTLALAATDTYPTGGIPLPAVAALGLYRNLQELRLTGHLTATTAYKLVVDYVNHKLQVYEEEAAAAGGPLLEADAAEVPGPRTFNFVATGW